MYATKSVSLTVDLSAQTLPREQSETCLLLPDMAHTIELAWTFIDQSFAWILFIGLTEVIGAQLLLWNRTKLLGVAVRLPVMVNIIVVFGLYFLDATGRWRAQPSTLHFLCVILELNRERVVEACHAILPAGAPRSNSIRTTAMALVLMAVLFAFDQLLVNLFGHGKG